MAEFKHKRPNNNDNTDSDNEEDFNDDILNELNNIENDMSNNICTYGDNQNIMIVQSAYNLENANFEFPTDLNELKIVSDNNTDSSYNVLTDELFNKFKISNDCYTYKSVLFDKEVEIETSRLKEELKKLQNPVTDKDRLVLISILRAILSGYTPLFVSKDNRLNSQEVNDFILTLDKNKFIKEIENYMVTKTTTITSSPTNGQYPSVSFMYWLLMLISNRIYAKQMLTYLCGMAGTGKTTMMQCLFSLNKYTPYVYSIIFSSRVKQHKNYPPPKIFTLAQVGTMVDVMARAYKTVLDSDDWDNITLTKALGITDVTELSGLFSTIDEKKKEAKTLMKQNNKQSKHSKISRPGSAYIYTENTRMLFVDEISTVPQVFHATLAELSRNVLVICAGDRRQISMSINPIIHTKEDINSHTTRDVHINKDISDQPYSIHMLYKSFRSNIDSEADFLEKLADGKLCDINILQQPDENKHYTLKMGHFTRYFSYYNKDVCVYNRQYIDRLINNKVNHIAPTHEITVVEKKTNWTRSTSTCRVYSRESTNKREVEKFNHYVNLVGFNERINHSYYIAEGTIVAPIANITFPSTGITVYHNQDMVCLEIKKKTFVLVEYDTYNKYCKDKPFSDWRNFIPTEHVFEIPITHIVFTYYKKSCEYNQLITVKSCTLLNATAKPIMQLQGSQFPEVDNMTKDDEYTSVIVHCKEPGATYVALSRYKRINKNKIYVHATTSLSKVPADMDNVNDNNRMNTIFCKMTRKVLVNIISQFKNYETLDSDEVSSLIKIALLYD